MTCCSQAAPCWIRPRGSMTCGFQGRAGRGTERFDPTQAARTVDVSGKLVTPGLIDLHFYHGGNPTSVNPDEICLSSGATTGVDPAAPGS